MTQALVAAMFLVAAARPEPGQMAPAFTLDSSGGKPVSLRDLRGRSVVVAFFQKAFTSGWTQELSAFRDIASRFADKNAQVLGVSTDDLDTQRKFADSLKLPFPLLADPKGEVVRAYGVEMQYKGKTSADRVTFVIDAGGKVTKVFTGDDALDPAPALDACPLHKKG
jgi:thioredoxin-dependent peroxiredoxin